MLISFKKKDGDSDGPVKSGKSSVKAKATTEFSDFIPYYCHYNADTLLTKNGELLQIIKIATNLNGRDYEGNTDDTNIVREAIRRALVKHVHSDKIALWIHTVRKRKTVNTGGSFKEAFANDVHNRWQQIHHWKYQYYNEIYITVMHDAQASQLLDMPNLTSIVIPKRNRDYRNAYLDVVHQELNDIVSGMIVSIREHFNATRLTLVERIPAKDEIDINQTIFYSEPMEFLGLLFNLRSQPFPLPQTDISESLVTTHLTLGFNALETKSADGKRRFGAILTLKQYRETPAETIDSLMQAPMEFIVCQAFHFIPHTGALQQYKEQKELFEISGDDYCIEASGIADMVESQSNLPTNFGEHQTSFMVLADEYKQLDTEIIKLQQAFSGLGLITIREDIKLEECFWSQLPGNFIFIRRKDTINTLRVGGFCRLNRYPNGAATGNHWGESVTILPTLVGSPYFFNFHHQDNGHSVVLDFNSFNDQVASILMNFFLCESRKFGSKLYVFDRNRSADLLFQKLGGNYHNFPVLSRALDQTQLTMNPFSLEDNKRNRSFLLAWMAYLISPSVTLPEAQKDILRTGIDAIYNEEPANRHLATFVKIIKTQNEPLAAAFGAWHGNGIHAGIFDVAKESFDLSGLLHAFDMTPVVKNKDHIVPIFAYLLHRIISEANGRPSMIIIHEALDLLDNEFIAPRLESIMEMLKENNVMIVFTSKKPFQFVKTPVGEIILNNCATRLYIPDDVRQNYISTELGISEYEAGQMVRMERQKGEFLLKQNNETIALRAYLKELDEYHAVFANDIKTLAAAVGKFSSSASSGI